MHRHTPRERLLAVALSMLAGFVDAIGFIALGGFFVSFMSGNTTRAGVGLAAANGEASTALLLIFGFVCGVVGGSLVGHLFRRRHRRTAVLVAVALLLAAASAAGDLGAPIAVSFGFAILGMGAINTVFVRSGEVTIGITYMTGNLVKLGQHISTALLGGDRWGWVPFLLLWLGLAAGALLGALTYRAIGLDGLWVAAAIAAVAAAAAAFVEPSSPP